jgi:hypothetical protein
MYPTSLYREEGNFWSIEAAVVVMHFPLAIAVQTPFTDERRREKTRES